MSREFVGYIVPDSIYNSDDFDKKNGRVIWSASLDKYTDGAYLYASEKPMKKQTPLSDENCKVC